MSDTEHKPSEIQRKAWQEEYRKIAPILEECLHGTPRGNAEPVLTADDLDRQAAEKRLLEALTRTDSGISFDSTKPLDVGTYLGNEQNDQRIRRDVKISRMNHKRLMLGCLKTLFWRHHDLQVAYGADK